MRKQSEYGGRGVINCRAEDTESENKMALRFREGAGRTVGHKSMISTYSVNAGYSCLA